MGEVFIGTEAVARGTVTRHELARWYRPIYPNVYAPRWHDLSLADRATGAWLWSKRAGIITGVAASALHGADWVDADLDIELLYNNTRPPAGMVARNERIADDEFTSSAIPIATPARTAFDLGRFLERGQAVARLDALMRARPFSAEDVLLMAKRYRGARGVKLLKDALPLVDGGAASPRETWLRLLYIDAGLPRPATQIPIFDQNGKVLRTVDMGWEEFMVVAEYDGEQHQTSRAQYVKDRRVIPIIESLGWIVLRVIKEDHPKDIVRRAWNAMVARGWRP
ncbi:hypothetical protein MGALJ_33140 [Mycobacterium gallinarum]|uniref:Cullin, a subunit of E3 ubiquitin ligase n=1 Tax=Mycobacterium gallinarum TaxID=39689 RepID=A0A9W4B4A3_9MYCO|nr:hypothetical protein [Mycobacterium gallinarum]BBY93645.1 hypothetical protein MGALJ_33140 [Mycobacterium gallinarum]